MRDPDPLRPLLLIPGPTEVDPAVAEAALRPMIGHRGKEITELLDACLPRVATMLRTQSPVFPLGCSASGAMEASIRNASGRPFLHLVCGAFSQRWSDMRAACGEDGDDLIVEWGEPILPAAVATALSQREYGAVTLVHNETSTGVMNPLADIAREVREHSDALLLVDTVSSMAAVPLELDAWGVDVCLAGTQKAWALPAGLTLCAVSERALARSERSEGRGFYLDWTRHARSLEKGQTPSTPPISLLEQLRTQLDRIDDEGWEARFQRHRDLRAATLAWADGRFEPFARDGYRSVTLSALRGGDVDLLELAQRLRARGVFLGGGYGKTKGEVFRVGHMGEWKVEPLRRALGWIDEELEAMA